MKIIILTLILLFSGLSFGAEYSVQFSQDGRAISVKREGDGASIPITLENADYRKFQDWNSKQAVPLVVANDESIQAAYDLKKVDAEAHRSDDLEAAKAAWVRIKKDNPDVAAVLKALDSGVRIKELE